MLVADIGLGDGIRQQLVAFVWKFSQRNHFMHASYPSVTMQIPHGWSDSEDAQLFFRELRKASSSILLLDYDGTLSPFQDDRLQTKFYDGVRERLEHLLSLSQTRVVLVSGRKAKELQSLVALSRPIEIWGSHGREHLALDGSYEAEPLTAFEEKALQEAISELTRIYDTDMLECKINSISIHWRKTSGIKPEVEAHVEQLYQRLVSAQTTEGSLQMLGFDGGIELRVGSGDKGDAVNTVLAGAASGTISAFLGDDLTDENAFRALLDHPHQATRLPVLVRQEPRPSLAQLWLSPPEELLCFLDEWIRSVESSR
jgi:trehalose-phosphatase